MRRTRIQVRRVTTPQRSSVSGIFGEVSTDFADYRDQGLRDEWNDWH